MPHLPTSCTESQRFGFKLQLEQTPVSHPSMCPSKYSKTLHHRLSRSVLLIARNFNCSQNGRVSAVCLEVSSWTYISIPVLSPVLQERMITQNWTTALQSFSFHSFCADAYCARSMYVTMASIVDTMQASMGGSCDLCGPYICDFSPVGHSHPKSLCQ